ncbi:GNAT family N-acetyltransferase [Pseudoalteromonas sp. NBT06-2]|uniref:GNAT family N-acetyltransferase n=1 Tax=Pseudoalteromonas sp. NBT06-2 TaxID=2025950 RepID=UPI000BA6F7F7|nr:GNAT family N-acetyltransferase [Pseudoalteromonas sp. NBT06-2]PAJ71776.1 GNAT family N-acetyltransferase [Pseudoalteromonas sp. NBT06-2]PAJ71777.1 GNAT family N-acetyltransferase [Pseudoalteromonas sp. NBT06-2]
MTIIYNFSDNQIEQLIQLYKDTGWGERSVEDTINCVKNSQICIGVLDQDNNLIGFTRIITDFIYKALILDVMVNVDYRGTGLGQKLMHNVKNHEKLKKVKHFELYCLPEMEAFYSNFGFSTDADGIKLMRSTNA